MEGALLPSTAAIILGAPLPQQPLPPPPARPGSGEQGALPPPPAHDASQLALAQYGVPESKFDLESDEEDDNEEDDALLPPGPIDAERCTVRINQFYNSRAALCGGSLAEAPACTG